VLGADFAWDLLWSVRTFVLSEADIGFNLKTLVRVLLILVVFTVFLWSIRKDLKALFTRT
jgi:hypothetical protein